MSPAPAAAAALGARVSILVVEDEESIGGPLCAGLENQGYAVTWVRSGRAALLVAAQTPPHVCLLDLGLPDLDGLDVARSLRTDHPDLLLLMLTARGDEIDVIVGLDAGADDYLAKPFTFAVLLARLRAHLRRRPSPAYGAALVVGDLRMDLTARRCQLGDVVVPLRPKEFDLLAVLATHPGAALSREQLMAEVWDENWFGSTKTLDVTMAALRRKLADATTAALARARVQEPVISTLRGHGYRLEAASGVG